MPSAMQVEVALDELNRTHGHLTPDLVVQAAQYEQSPIHSIFEWDDGKAAHQHRLWQARRLIRSVQNRAAGRQADAQIPVDQN